MLTSSGRGRDANPQFVRSPRKASSDINLRRISFTSTSSTKLLELSCPCPQTGSFKTIHLNTSSSPSYRWSPSTCLPSRCRTASSSRTVWTMWGGVCRGLARGTLSTRETEWDPPPLQNLSRPGETGAANHLRHGLRAGQAAEQCPNGTTTATEADIEY